MCGSCHITGALTDGKDAFRFYRMTRTDSIVASGSGSGSGSGSSGSGSEMPSDQFLFGDFGDPESGITSPYSYHIQLSPTLSGGKNEMDECKPMTHLSLILNT